MRRLFVLSLALFLLAPLGPAFAHGFGEIQNLPVPLWLFLFGASAVVIVSFFQMGLLVGERHALRQYPRVDLLRVGPLRALLTGKPLLLGLRLLSVTLFLLVVLSGFLGVQQTAGNLAPTFVWIVWWVGLGFFTAFVGNVWPLLNPWKILFEWADGLTRSLGLAKGLELREPYPASWGVWPALMLYAAFVWTELVFEGSAEPSNIAFLALLYAIPTWCGMAVFGRETWLQRGEAFSVFFSIIGRFAPTELRVTDPRTCRDCVLACRTTDGGCVNCYECFARTAPEDRELNLRPWAVGLVSTKGVSPSQLAFIVFVLAAVAYDSLLPTPLWAKLQDLTSVSQTLGLVVVPLCFLFAYLGFVKFSQLSGGSHLPFGRLAATYIYSLVPIAVVYQVAHYYTFLFIQGQAIIALVSDPFGLGWNLFGTSGYGIKAALFDAAFVWYSQVALIIAGHVVAVYLSHVASIRLLRSPRLAIRAQLPMLGLMVLYTVFSLWILSRPIIETAPVERESPLLTSELRDEEGSRVGTARFSEGTSGVEITVSLRKGQRAISPGEHGVHIHERSTVTPGLEAAGGHFDPTNAHHGFANPLGPHAGDLVNMVVMADGSAEYSTANGRVTLSGSENGLLDEEGSALIITEEPDDYVTDPDGNSGAAAAGSVIERSAGLPAPSSGLPALVVLLSITAMVPWGLLFSRRLRGQ